jgi:chemotaxis protein histidine kinase CheA
LKFARENGDIQACAQREGDTIMLFVADDGPAFPIRKKPR